MSNASMLENGRAKFAYDCAEKAKAQLKEKDKEYKAYAKNIPMMIKINGLGATLAFMKAKSKDGNAYEILYNQISKWLKEEKKLISNNDLAKEIVEKPSSEYRFITIEVLALMSWLRRFADGLIKGDD
jgi:CRISPR-associated protein Cmr5